MTTHWQKGGHEIDRSEIHAVAEFLRTTGQKEEAT